MQLRTGNSRSCGTRRIRQDYTRPMAVRKLSQCSSDMAPDENSDTPEAPAARDTAMAWDSSVGSSADTKSPLNRGTPCFCVAIPSLTSSPIHCRSSL